VLPSRHRAAYCSAGLQTKSRVTHGRLPLIVGCWPVHLLRADMTYFSLVTLATVGYGDVLPATH
jgi:voltage-gated potassium channel Kch